MQTFTGLEYLKIDLANHLGKDKLNYAERIKFIDEKSHEELCDLCNELEEPALAKASYDAIQCAYYAIPSGYPISLDATASGTQLFAVLTGCETTARQCNVIDTGRREDAYTNVYTEFCARVDSDTLVNKSDFKQAVMTYCYGSEAEPKRVFGEGEYLSLFYEVLNDLIPGAVQLNEFIQSMWNPTKLEYSWVLPDNYHVVCKNYELIEKTVKMFGKTHMFTVKENKGLTRSKSLCPNVIHSIDGLIPRELTYRCNYDVHRVYNLTKLLLEGKADKLTGDNQLVKILWDHYINSGFLSTRSISYLNESNLHLVCPDIILSRLNSLPIKPFDVTSNHDCFRCLPNYGNDLRQQYNNVLGDIAGSNLLQFILRQISVNPKLVVNKFGDIQEQVYNTNYAIT